MTSSDLLLGVDPGSMRKSGRDMSISSLYERTPALSSRFARDWSPPSEKV